MNISLFAKPTFISIIFVFIVMSLFFPFISPFLPYIIVVYALYYILLGKIEIPVNFGLVLFYLLIFFYFWGVFQSGGVIYQLNKLEFRNMLLIIILLFLIGPITLNDFKASMAKSADILSVLIPIVSILSLYKLYLFKKGVYIDFLFNSRGEYPSGTSLVNDYNMFSLGIFIGMILLIGNYIKSNSLFSEVYYLASTNIIALTLLLTGSRRAFVILLIVLLYFAFIFVKKVRISQHRIKSVVLLLFFLIGTFIYFGKLTSDTSILADDFDRVFDRYETIQHKDEGFSSRSKRWSYAVELIEEGNVYEFLFGKGFNYLKMYQNKFNTLNEDYPHNFILASFIYSGFIGAMVTIILIIHTFIKMLRLRKDIGTSSILVYMVILTFLSISGNTIITVRIFPLYLLIILLVCVNKQKSNPIQLQNHQLKLNESV